MNRTIQKPQTRGTFRWTLVLSGTVALAMAVCCTGCLVPKFYVDPTFRGATAQSIKPADRVRPAVINVEFQVNGKRVKKQGTIVRRKVVRTLTLTGVFSEAGAADAARAGRLDVIVNNVGDIGAAMGKGFLTGLTFGFAGAHIVDGYEMSVTYTPPGGSPITRKYRHALHSTVGMIHSPPTGLVPVPLPDAFDQIVEEMLLNFLRDFQRGA